MENRLNIQELYPAAWKGMYALSAAIANTQLTKTQQELIKIRASQINGCAFCLDMHTKDALKYGESAQRIFLLNAWRETSRFTDEEKAILAITEEVTLIHQHGLSDEVFAQAKQFFTDEVIAQIIVSVVAINAWNRIAVSSRTAVPE